MPAQSKAQQQLMGMAYALKKGEMKPEDASQEVKDLAASMTLKQLKDFAETKHKGLPDKVKESNSKMKIVSKEEWNTAHKDYKIIIKGQKYMMEYDDSRNATILVPVIVEGITPSGIGGMGSVKFPTKTEPGSGDVPAGSDIDDEEEIKNQKINKTMKHIKLFDAFINESELSESKLSYWKDYENSNPESPDWYNDTARNKIQAIKLLDAVVELELGEMDDKDASIEPSDIRKLTKLVLAYLKEFGSINGNVISAMLYQGGE